MSVNNCGSLTFLGLTSLGIGVTIIGGVPVTALTVVYSVLAGCIGVFATEVIMLSQTVQREVPKVKVAVCECFTQIAADAEKIATETWEREKKIFMESLEIERKKAQDFQAKMEKKAREVQEKIEKKAREVQEKIEKKAKKCFEISVSSCLGCFSGIVAAAIQFSTEKSFNENRSLIDYYLSKSLFYLTATSSAVAFVYTTYLIFECNHGN